MCTCMVLDPQMESCWRLAYCVGAPTGRGLLQGVYNSRDDAICNGTSLTDVSVCCRSHAAADLL